MDSRNEIRDAIGTLVALLLWECKAVQVRSRDPFRLVSGNYSPIYIDCRKLLSDPAFLDIFVAAVKSIQASAQLTIDVVAGGETAGIPYATAVARALNLPMVYVRKESKSHGTRSRVEGGSVRPGSKILLVEDLITDAGSKLSFIEALRGDGAVVEDTIVIFDRKQGGHALLWEHGVTLHALADIDRLLDVAVEAHVISKQELDEIVVYLDSPAKWHEQRSLPYSSKKT